MRQLVQDLRSGSLEVLELPDPRPGPGEVLVRTTWSLISPGTEQAVAATAEKSFIGKARERPDQARLVIDKALRDGLRPTLAAVSARLDDLLTPGYSSTGIVEAVGSAVDGIAVGDRVGCVGAGAACHAELAVVPAPLCLSLPDTLEDRWGAFGALGGIAAHGVRVAEVEAGATVVVIGVGLVGQLAAQLVRAAGGRVIAVDPVAQRVALAQAMGASAGAVLGVDDVETLVDEVSGGHGADAVIITAATKDSAPLRLAASIARDRAVIAAVGDVGLDVPRRPFYEKELQLRVSRSYGPGRYDPAYEREGHDYPIGYVRWTERRLIAYFFEEVAAGRVRLEELVTHQFQIDDGKDAYHALADPARLAILLHYPTVARPPIGRAILRPTTGSQTGVLRVALIGPGMFARSILLPKLRRLNVDVVGIGGKSSARAFGVAKRFGAAFVAGNHEELLADDSVDVVIIATQHDSHAALASRALESGKAVFLEKPLAIDQAELPRIEQLLEAGGRLVVDFNRSLSPAVGLVSDHFAKRREPIHVDCRVNAGYLDPSHWLRDPRRGGGRLVGEGCHFVDLCSTLIDRRLQSAQVQALGSAPLTLPGDNFVLTLTYEDGSLGTVRYISSGDPRLGKERVEVIGSAKAAVIDDFRSTRLYARRRRTGDRRPHSQDKGHDAMLDAALRFFRGVSEPPVPYERMLETTRATLVAREALEQGRDSAVVLRA